MKEIFERLKADFEYTTGYEYVGLVKSIGAGFAARTHELMSKLRHIERQAFITTADEDALYLHGGELLELKAERTAEGNVVFSGQDGSVIPSGTVVKFNDIEYRTTKSETIIYRTYAIDAAVDGDKLTLPVRSWVVTGKYQVYAPADASQHPIDTAGTPTTQYLLQRQQLEGIDWKKLGSELVGIDTPNGVVLDAGSITNGQRIVVTRKYSDVIAATAVKSGAKGNRLKSELLKLSVTLPGVDDARVSVMNGGRDVEPTEEYRLRVKQFLSKPNAPFSKSDISQTIINAVPNLKYAWVKGGELERGKVKVFIMNHDFEASAEEQADALTATQSIRPAQMPEDSVTVTDADVRKIDVVINNLTPPTAELEEEVRRNIKHIFNTDLFEKGITTQQIESAVYRSEYSRQRVQSFTVESGSCARVSGVFWKLSNVNFTYKSTT
jgi:uncharacterized phage protein gp47/JayE